MNIESTLERFILDELLIGSKAKLGYDESLIDSGIVDSLGLLRLMAFVEKEFNVAIEDDEVIGENFQTINVMKALIERKL